MRPLVVFAAAALTAGCLPVPVRHISSPPLSGTVANAGTAVTDARVCVSGYDPDDARCTTTDAHGRFSLPTRKSTSVMMLLGDRLLHYRVDITTASGDSFPGYKFYRTGSPSRPDPRMRVPLHLDCNLSGTPEHLRGHDIPESELTFCTPSRAHPQ